MGNSGPDLSHYQLHRAALRPLLSPAVIEELGHSAELAAQYGEKHFFAFLLRQGLAPLWHHLLEQHRASTLFSTGFRDSLRQARLHAAGVYLVQRNSMERVGAILEDAGIRHAAYKGADLRERCYDEPALRPAADIDLLVADHDKTGAITALQRQGFAFCAKPDNISHEASLVKGATAVDLHWDILRPGRTRIPVTGKLLAQRIDYGSHWGLNDAHSLFVMLVHPVFAKYSNAPQAALVSLCDLARILRSQDLDRTETERLLTLSGLRTAAWITLCWFRMVTGATSADDLLASLRPGRLRERYLDSWLHGNLSTRLSDHPIYVQLGLTLPAHDTLADAIRAVLRKRQAAKRADTELQRIARQISQR